MCVCVRAAGFTRQAFLRIQFSAATYSFNLSFSFSFFAFSSALVSLRQKNGKNFLLDGISSAWVASKSFIPYARFRSRFNGQSDETEQVKEEEKSFYQ